MKLAIEELAANDMLKTMFPNLNVLARISLNYSCYDCLSGTKLFTNKARLRSCLKDSSLSSLMKIAMETTGK